MPDRSPTFGLLTGLLVTISAVAVYSGYTIVQLRSLRSLQAEFIDRNRMDSLLLLRIQNDVNSVGLAMRDMLDTSADTAEPYPLVAWAGQFKRIRVDLADALTREGQISPATSDQRRYLTSSVAQFWDALDRTFQLAQSGQEEEARTRIRLSLQARQSALSTAVSRLLVRNNEREQQAAAQTQAIYARAERNVYLFLAAMLLVVAATGLYLTDYYRRMFQQVAELSTRRSDLARQLISIQENTLRYVSRELHDEFGQILTAIGVMLQRTGRRAANPAVQSDIAEVRDIVQSSLDKVRGLSQALHPVILDDAGFEGALSVYLPGFQKQTGVEVDFHNTGTARSLDRAVSIHLYRILQEALNNVVRHAKSTKASVRIRYLPESVILEVEDQGVGFSSAKSRPGLGLISMRERAELLNGRIEFTGGTGGGALVRLTVPTPSLEAHAES